MGPSIDTLASRLARMLVSPNASFAETTVVVTTVVFWELWLGITTRAAGIPLGGAFLAGAVFQGVGLLLVWPNQSSSSPAARTVVPFAGRVAVLLSVLIGITAAVANEPHGGFDHVTWAATFAVLVVAVLHCLAPWPFLRSRKRR